MSLFPLCTLVFILYVFTRETKTVTHNNKSKGGIVMPETKIQYEMTLQEMAESISIYDDVIVKMERETGKNIVS